MMILSQRDANTVFHMILTLLFMISRIFFLSMLLLGLSPILSTEAAPACVQVVQYAENSTTGECQAYATPCDVPTGWTPVKECSIATKSKTITPKFEVQKFASCTEMENKMVDILKRYQSRYWYPMYAR